MIYEIPGIEFDEGGCVLLKDYGNLLRKEHWLVRMVFIFN
jgi:hypothetical protein